MLLYICYGDGYSSRYPGRFTLKIRVVVCWGRIYSSHISPLILDLERTEYKGRGVGFNF